MAACDFVFSMYIHVLAKGGKGRFILPLGLCIVPVAELRFSREGRVPLANTMLTLCHVCDVICTSSSPYATASHSVKLSTFTLVLTAFITCVS